MINSIPFINKLLKYGYNVFDDFLKFIVENKLLSFFMAAIITLAITNLISSFKVNIIDYYLNKIFKTTNNNLINLFTTFMQSGIIIIFLYFVYNNFIKKLINKYEINKFNEIEWKNSLLNEIRDIKTNIK
jgi:large-conductance mechanosensitive channel